MVISILNLLSIPLINCLPSNLGKCPFHIFCSVVYIKSLVLHLTFPIFCCYFITFFFSYHMYTPCIQTCSWFLYHSFIFLSIILCLVEHLVDHFSALFWRKINGSHLVISRVSYLFQETNLKTINAAIWCNVTIDHLI